MRAPKVQTEIRQEQITRAALALISRHGFHRLRVASLAREVGVVPSGVYRHFKGKEAVLDAVVDLIAGRLLTNVVAVRQETPDSVERLHRLLLRHVQLVQGEIPIPRLVFSEQVFLGRPERRRRVYRMFSDYLTAVASLIREGQAHRELRPELDPATIAVMFLGLVQPSVILWLMSDGEFDLAGQADRAWTLFRTMIRSDPGPEPPTPSSQRPTPNSTLP